MAQLMQQLGGMTLIWMQVTLLLLLGVIAAWKRDVIVRLGAMRAAFLWLAMSFIVPSILNMLLPLLANYISPANPGQRYNRNADPFSELMGGAMAYIYPVLQGATPILVGITILFLSRALLPTFIPPVNPGGVSSTRPAPMQNSENPPSADS